MHRVSAVVVGIVGYVALLAAGFLWFVPRMEEDLTERAESALVTLGVNDVEVSFDGRNGTVDGPSAALAEDRLADLRGARWVRAGLTTAPAVDPIPDDTVPTTAPPPSTTETTTTTSAPPAELASLRITQAGETVVLEGSVATEQDRLALLAEARRSGYEIDDRLTVDPTLDPVDRTVVSSLPLLRPVLSGSNDGEIVIESGTVALAATAADPVENEQIQLAIDQVRDGGVELSAELDTLVLTEDEQVVALESEIEQAFELARRIQTESPNFGTSQDSLNDAARDILDRVAIAMRRYPLPPVEIEGHTDSVGSTRANQTLSEARATTVADYLATQGVVAERLETSGAGEANPVASNATEDGRLENRRVNFIVGKTEG